MSSFTAFAFLIITAVAYYYLGKLILFLVACYFFFRGWVWLCHRYPNLSWFVYGFIRGLMR